MIPRKFMTTYGDDLANCILLKAPDGSIWQVKLERRNSQTWLKNGWPDFAAHYSICFGHLIVFKYEGNSHFHVAILDKSATEVEYPLSGTSHSEKAYVTDLGKRKEDTNDDIRRKENSKVCFALSAQYAKTVSDCGKFSHQVSKTTLQVTSEAEHARALASAKAFQSTNPYFKIKMCPSCVSGKFTLSVPRKFFITYITQDHCNVILQLSDERAWPVNCRISHIAAKFSGGWRRFAQANSLAVGNVCVFELIDRSKKLVHVGIFR